MKNTITIFVSGSKRLKDHRLRLKALVNNMNGENRLNGSPVVLNMFSYVNLGDNQAEYDAFIKDKADIVLFLIEDRLGDKTRDELLLASKTFKETGTPKILVFMKEFKERTPEIDEIERFVSDNAPEYYVDYSNLEDLEYKVRERLNHEVEALMDKGNASSKKKIRKLRLQAAIASIVCAAALLFSILGLSADRSEVTLLFIGGGSAVRCLEEKCPTVGNLYNYPHSICIAVPTSTSWPIVSSEVMQHHAVKGEKQAKRFFPVSLSAMEADEASFLKMNSQSQFISKGSVLSYYLGEDYLAVYVKNSYRNSIIDGKESISTRELADFLQSLSEENVMIFTTEEGSGTLTYYQSSLAPYDITLTKASLGEHVDKFSDLTPRSKIRRDESPYIMLGSRFYVAQEVYEDGDCRPIRILDEEGNPITKSIYLYFAGYYEDGGTSYWIPNEMVSLLKKVDSRFENVIKNNRIPRMNERVIVSLNDYLN